MHDDRPISRRHWRELVAKVDAILFRLDIVNMEEVLLMADLNTVKDAVTAQTTVVGSVVTLLEGLSAQLAAAVAANDPVAIQAVADSISANTKMLADAVAANTPAAPGPAPAPEPVPAPAPTA